MISYTYPLNNKVPDDLIIIAITHAKSNQLKQKVYFNYHSFFSNNVSFQNIFEFVSFGKISFCDHCVPHERFSKFLVLPYKNFRRLPWSMAKSGLHTVLIGQPYLIYFIFYRRAPF